jgi:hypothetical protein
MTGDEGQTIGVFGAASTPNVNVLGKRQLREPDRTD